MSLLIGRSNLADDDWKGPVNNNPRDLILIGNLNHNPAPETVVFFHMIRVILYDRIEKVFEPRLGLLWPR